MAAAATARTYVDFLPPHSLLEEPDKVTLRVDLSAEGFKKEQLRVQTEKLVRLRISGERPLGAGDNRWRRFGKDFHVPEGCDTGAIRARLEKDGVLLITMPRLSTAPAEEQRADTGRVAGQDRKGQTSAPQAAAAAATAAAEAEEDQEGDKEDDAGVASMERPGQDEQHTGNNAMATYGFAKDRRRAVWAIFAVVLALVGAGLYARYRLMDPSAETTPASTQIVALSE
ncbi:inactive protein RESTRICTED TEV MOVEMENT 2-like [Phragmites australis]|uniref:inactive protein RESTRICTED TEV MOVEMENT 2-like n=1 Tax=Phragmites australis TaxID=29695 RepID=UPI002D780C1E|nr:inactive protein RESTRICTED TEV MOVEMENT 2-like [Phragmites australis]